MRRPADDHLDRMRDRLLGPTGAADRSLRRAALLAEGDLPEPLDRLVGKMRTRAYTVTDEDVAEARRQWSDSELFEVFVAAAVGAGLARRDAVDRLLAADEPVAR